MELGFLHGIQVQVEGYRVNAYLRCVDTQETRAGVEGIDITAEWG